MARVDPVPPDRPSEGLVGRQREVNEKLVLAGIRAQEEAEAALEAKRAAEAAALTLKARQNELEATAELRELLIGIIGHDLRNPLNTIVMAAGCQLAREALSAEDIRLADRIVSSGHRMARMIGQLVEFTRARLGSGLDLHVGHHDLGDICRDIADEIRVASATKVVQTASGNLRGTWDADRLSQVVSNIAGNAVDHAAPGTPILIHAFDDGDFVVGEVMNRGADIPADVLPVIFKPFRGAEDKSPGRGGHLGLGLYIACEIVRAHGGTLDASSGGGLTTFTFRLPRVPSTPHPLV